MLFTFQNIGLNWLSTHTSFCRNASEFCERWNLSFSLDFLMFDTRQEKFVKIERKDITKTYTKKGICNYCPCRRKLQSSTTVIKHLQVLETRFFCYLMLDDEKYNDEKNKERLAVYLNAIETDEIKNPTLTLRGTATVGYKGNRRLSSYPVKEERGELMDSEEYADEESESMFDENEDVDSNDENLKDILEEFKDSFTKTYDKMNDFISQLKISANSSTLDQGIVDSQEQFKLIKRNEDFQANEKDVTFLASINLNYEDMNYLLNKYGVSDVYEIDRAEVVLNVQLKGCQENVARRSSGQQALVNAQKPTRSIPLNKDQIRLRKKQNGQPLEEGNFRETFKRFDYQTISPSTNVLRPMSNGNDCEDDNDESTTEATDCFERTKYCEKIILDSSSIPFRFKKENCLVEDDYEVNEPNVKRIRCN